jgi:hypothetical protein
VLIFVGFSSIVIAQSETSEIKRLSKDADVILSGKVTQKESKWNDSKTRIYTKTSVQVDEFLKGNNNDNTVEIRTPGGEVDDVGELYTHMPRFENEEEVLVFLKKNDQSKEFKVLYGEEGKIKVIRDTKSKEKVTSSNMRLKDLKSQIKGYLKEQ